MPSDTYSPVGRPKNSSRQSLVVNAVPRFVQDAEEAVAEGVFVVTGREPHIAGAESGAERVVGHVEPAGVEVETNRRRGELTELFLRGGRISSREDTRCRVETNFREIA